MNSYGLSKEVVAKLHQIFKTHPQIIQVKLYGSRAKGNYQEYSDIDLAVYGDGKLDRFIIADILTQINDSNIPYLIDIQDYHNIKNKNLIEHIDRVGIIIYQQE